MMACSSKLHSQKWERLTIKTVGGWPTSNPPRIWVPHISILEMWAFELRSNRLAEGHGFGACPERSRMDAATSPRAKGF
jgi:hypothetical protein